MTPNVPDPTRAARGEATNWSPRRVSPPADAPEPTRLLKAGRGFLQPDIWVVDLNGRPRVWKTWARRPGWERRLFGRWLAGREGRILRALADLEGFPRFLAYPHSHTLEMSLMDAEPVPEIKLAGHLDRTYFDRLELLLTAMHTRGINHGDLRRKNLLRAPGDPSTPLIVDFTQCLHWSPPRGFFRDIVFREAIRIDRVTFLKLKKWFLGEDALTTDELEEMNDVPWHLTLGRLARKKVYRPFKHWRQRRTGH